jgi:hypothetical protein
LVRWVAVVLETSRVTASAAQPPFVVAGRMGGDRQPARESDSRAEVAYSTLFCTGLHVLS